MDSVLWLVYKFKISTFLFRNKYWEMKDRKNVGILIIEGPNRTCDKTIYKWAFRTKLGTNQLSILKQANVNEGFEATDQYY